MREWLAIIAAATGAAATMYYFDPDMGRRRRAALRRRSAANEMHHAIDRVRGVLASAERQAGTTRSDAQLRDRIRTRLDHLVSHPRCVDVTVDDGVARLTGDVLVQELDGLLTQVRDMQGVKRVINALTAHHNPHDVVRRATAARPHHEEQPG
jgi:osmotically-inducible protein OsmY